jgi:hypothetical protein
METRISRPRQCRPARDAPCRLECENADHLRRTEIAVDAVGPAHSGEGARAYCVSAVSERHSGPFVEPLARAKRERLVAVSIKGDDADEVGPQKVGLGKDAALYDMVTLEALLLHQAFGDCLRIVEKLDAARALDAQIVKMR